MQCATCETKASESVKLMRCGTCKAARYCGAACQSAHWPQHKIVCQSGHIAKGTGVAARDGIVGDGSRPPLNVLALRAKGIDLARSNSIQLLSRPSWSTCAQFAPGTTGGADDKAPSYPVDADVTHPGPAAAETGHFGFRFSFVGDTVADICELPLFKESKWVPGKHPDAWSTEIVTPAGLRARLLELFPARHIVLDCSLFAQLYLALGREEARGKTARTTLYINPMPGLTYGLYCMKPTEAKVLKAIQGMRSLLQAQFLALGVPTSEHLQARGAGIGGGDRKAIRQFVGLDEDGVHSLALEAWATRYRQGIRAEIKKFGGRLRHGAARDMRLRTLNANLLQAMNGLGQLNSFTVFPDDGSPKILVELA